MNVFELCILVQQWYMYILSIRYIVSLNSSTVSGIFDVENFILWYMYFVKMWLRISDLLQNQRRNEMSSSGIICLFRFGFLFYFVYFRPRRLAVHVNNPILHLVFKAPKVVSIY